MLRLHHRHETGLRAHLWHGAQRANEAGGWGYRVEPLPRNLEALQSVRYEAPNGWYAEHVDTRFTWSRLNHTYSERVIAAIVQLSDRHDRAVKRPWLAPARAATDRCRSPPAGSGLSSELPSRSEKGSLAAWMPKGGSGGALMPEVAASLSRHAHAGDYSGGELQLVLRSGAVPAFPTCACGPQPRRPQPSRDP